MNSSNSKTTKRLARSILPTPSSKCGRKSGKKPSSVLESSRRLTGRNHRYNEILFMIDTCQANTMYSQFYSPNILATGSSEIEENSYSASLSFDPVFSTFSSQAARKRQRHRRLRHRQLYSLCASVHGGHQQDEPGFCGGLGTQLPNDTLPDAYASTVLVL